MTENWDDLRYFLALVEHGSVSRAAKSLSVNHTTVSRRVQSLEESTGVTLFERTPDGYVMSDAASAILPAAQAVQREHSKVQRLLQSEDHRLSGTIRVTMPHDLFDTLLAEDIQEFTALHPEISLELSVSKGLKNLANREADIAVRFTPSPPDYLVGREVCKITHAVYVSDTIDLSAGPVPVIVWNSEPDTPEWVNAHFPEHRVVLKIDDLTSMYSAVKAGIGAARMPVYMPDKKADANVKKISSKLPASDWGVWVLNHVDLRNNARVQLLKNFLLERLQKRVCLFDGHTT